MSSIRSPDGAIVDSHPLWSPLYPHFPRNQCMPSTMRPKPKICSHGGCVAVVEEPAVVFNVCFWRWQQPCGSGIEIHVASEQDLRQGSRGRYSAGRLYGEDTSLKTALRGPASALGEVGLSRWGGRYFFFLILSTFWSGGCMRYSSLDSTHCNRVDGSRCFAIFDLCSFFCVYFGCDGCKP